jgi:DNA (cytosine-5)-methyltransferase 1
MNALASLNPNSESIAIQTVTREIPLPHPVSSIRESKESASSSMNRRKRCQSDESRDRHSIPLISLFTGAGFLDIGLAQSGFASCYHNEFNSDFARGFSFGMSTLGRSGPEAVVQSQESILTLSSDAIIGCAFDRGKKPDTFGIVGGPPCPDFSVGGKNLGAAGERGKLSSVYVDRILSINPSFFLFENVPGLIRTLKHRQFLGQLLQRLLPHYLLDMRLLNALDFGVPQDRERLFIVGFCKRYLRESSAKALLSASPSIERLMSRATANSDEHAETWFPWDRNRKHLNAKASYRWPTTKPFGSPSTACPEEIPLDLTIGPLMISRSDFQTIPNSMDLFRPKSRRFLTVEEGDVSRKSFKRLHRWRYSPAAGTTRFTYIRQSRGESRCERRSESRQYPMAIACPLKCRCQQSLKPSAMAFQSD